MVEKKQQIECQLPPIGIWISKENSFHVADWASEACHLRILYDIWVMIGFIQLQRHWNRRVSEVLKKLLAVRSKPDLGANCCSFACKAPPFHNALAPSTDPSSGAAL